MNPQHAEHGQYCCVTCARVVPLDDPRRRYLPFCSHRCQMIDLGRWLDEQYVISTPLSEADLTDPDVQAQLDVPPDAEPQPDA